MYQYNIDLYTNSSENNDVQKVIANKTSVIGYARNSVDILNPVIDLQSMVVNDFNYAYIQELKRYYYIEGVSVAPNGSYRVTFRVDVLMSYINDIKASSGLITKQRDYNPYYGDDDIEARSDLETLEFEDKFNHDGEFVIVALKG